jgi:hypothetical protein
MARYIDLCTVRIEQAVVHPETRQEIAKVGDLLINVLPALRDAGADWVLTSHGVFSI